MLKNTFTELCHISFPSSSLCFSLRSVWMNRIAIFMCLCLKVLLRYFSIICAFFMQTASDSAISGDSAEIVATYSAISLGWGIILNISRSVSGICMSSGRARLSFSVPVSFCIKFIVFGSINQFGIVLAAF